jgi:hypothetical protein
MNVDRLIGIVGIVIGALGVLVAIFVPLYFYRKSLRPKVLIFANTMPVPISIGDRPSLPFSDTKLRSFLLLWNNGSAPIVEGDFVRPISIDKPKEVTEIKIFRKDAATALQVENNSREIQVKLLRPNEAVVLEIISGTSEELSLSIEMMSADMSSFFRRGRRIPQSLDAIISTLVHLSLGLIVFLIFKYVNFTTEWSLGLAFVAVMASSTLFPDAGVLMQKATTPSVVWSFFMIKEKADRAHQYTAYLKDALASLERENA